MQFRSNYQMQDWDKGTINNEPSMVQPEHEMDLEINNIMERYARTGYMPVADIAPAFADLSVPMDFADAQDKVLRAQQLFIQLPIEIRDEFRTAQELLNAFNSPRGVSKLEALGVLQKPVKNDPVDPAPQGGQQQEPAVGAVGDKAL